jgi:predicted CXXCH cytochrome family protein
MVAVVAGALAARPLALRSPRPRSDIEKALAGGPHSGDCEQCHTTHGEDTGLVYPNALVGPDDNQLCYRCHAVDWKGGSFANDPLYRATGHGSSTTMIWPGGDTPGRLEPDAATKCLNCHDAHGWSDAQGEIPTLRLKREESLCLACHDGSPAQSNVSLDLGKAYRHPTSTLAGRHASALEGQPADFGVLPLDNRHAECEDCHNPHVSRSDGATEPLDAQASNTTLGVSRVSVLNGPAGARPLYTFVAGSDTLSAPNDEYQLCFKCHSSFTTQPAGQSDLGVQFNPSNPSFHPIEAQGRNANIDPMAFVAGWSANSFTRCGSCHGSDFGSVRGPHGSNYRFILKAPYTASAALRAMDSNELCFQCHSFEVYADDASPSSVKAASRFNAPAMDAGHTKHVGEENVSCYTCHVTHGSSSQSFLLVTGRSPGLVSYTRSPNGGTCAPTCHGSESYTVNYAR